MMFQILQKTLNLRKLLPALTLSNQAYPLPFYILKTNPKNQPITRETFLSVNSKMTNQTLANHFGPFSIWSPHHIHRLEASGVNILDQQILIKNPYKSSQFIDYALSKGINKMCIDSYEQFQKIEMLRTKRNKRISFYWTLNEDSDPLELQELQPYLHGLSIEWNSIKNIRTTAEKVIRESQNLTHLICSGKSEDMAELQKWQKAQQFGKKNLRKTMELDSFSEIENYMLAAPILDKRRTIIHEQAQALLSKIDLKKDSMIVSHANQQWLFSKFSHFPMDEQPFIFQMEENEPSSSRMDASPVI